MKSASHQTLLSKEFFPKYDFPEHLVNATPGVNRIMSYEVEEINSKDQVKMTDSDVIVFNRPEHFIGSNGSLCGLRSI